MLVINFQCTAGSVCKKTCAGDELDCYILDDNGFIILSEDVTQTGRFFGQVDGTIMDSLVQDRIYKKVTVHDHQGRCPDSRNPFSGSSNKLGVNIDFERFFSSFSFSSFNSVITSLQPIRPLAWVGGYLTNLLAVWFPLWESVKAHARPYADEDLGKLFYV